MWRFEQFDSELSLRRGVNGNLISPKFVCVPKNRMGFLKSEFQIPSIYIFKMISPRSIVYIKKKQKIALIKVKTVPKYKTIMRRGQVPFSK